MQTSCECDDYGDEAHYTLTKWGCEEGVHPVPWERRLLRRKKRFCFVLSFFN